LAVKKSAYVLAGHCAEKGLLEESNNLERQGEDVPRTTNYGMTRAGWYSLQKGEQTNFFGRAPRGKIT